MSTEANALALAIQIGNDVKMLKETIGNPADLQTNASTLEGAISELQDQLNALNNPNTIIDQ